MTTTKPFLQTISSSALEDFEHSANPIERDAARAERERREAEHDQIDAAIEDATANIHYHREQIAIEEAKLRRLGIDTQALQYGDSK
jgi:hypothetical protein